MEVKLGHILYKGYTYPVSGKVYLDNNLWVSACSHQGCEALLSSNEGKLKTIGTHTHERRHIPENGFIKCFKGHCNTCKIVDYDGCAATDELQFGCEAGYIIYELKCHQCRESYIGQTIETLRQ